MSGAPGERWRLEHPEQSPPLDVLQGLGLHLRLWRYPREDAPVSYGLFVPLDPTGRPLVRELRGDAPADRVRRDSAVAALKRRPSETPDVRVRDALVDVDALAPFLAEASSILSAFTERPPVDPERDLRGIEGYRSLTHARFAWNPPSDHPVSSWTDRLWELLEASLRDRETA